MNFYQTKYEALETFYGWIDQGSTYEVAVEQSEYYNHQENELEKIIFNITIATRFSRCGKSISKQFKERLVGLISKYKSLNLESYCLKDEELQLLNEEVAEIEMLIDMIE